jgi:O-antigen/teichoic acid export membrane protein
MTTAVAASTVAVAVSWYTSSLRLEVRGVGWWRYRQMLRSGLPFLGLNVAIFIRNQIDILLVGVLLSTAASGWLAAAYRIVGVPMVAPIILMRPLLPALTSCVDDPDVFRQTLRDAMVLVLFVTAPASALLVATAPTIPAFLAWGSEFERSVSLIQVLALTVPLSSAVIVLGTGLLALKRERPWLVVTLVAAAFNAGANIVVVPWAEANVGDGALGATIIELATELILFGGAARLMPASLIAPGLARHSLKIVAASVLVAGVSSLLLSAGLIASIASGALVYLAATFALGVMPLAQLCALVHDIRGHRRRTP